MIVFGIQLLAGAPRRAVHLAAAALDAGERVEHALAAEILHRLEADLFLLEIEVRHVAELRRLQEHGDRRQHQVKVLRCRDQREEREDHDRVHPPVDARRPTIASSSRHVSRNVTISVAMNSADHDRFDRHVRAQRDRADERAADQQVDDAAPARRLQTA